MIILTLLVVLILIFPVRKQKINFDEKAEVISIYREDVAYIKQQFKKNLIDENERDQLLNEIDKKSVNAMQSIEQRSFAYRSPLAPIVLIVGTLMLASALYVKLYTEQKVHIWHDNAQHFGSKIVEGLFDKKTVEKTLAESNKRQKDSYCFLLQQEMLNNYSQNAEAIVNVAECHLQMGFAKPASQAIQRALSINADNLRANYLYAELQFLKIQQLIPQTEKKLITLFEKNPTATDIGYLLMLNSFSHGRLTEVQRYADTLKPFTDTNPVLKDAVDGLLAQSTQQSEKGMVKSAPVKQSSSEPDTPVSINHNQQLQQTDNTMTVQKEDTNQAVAEFKATITIDKALRNKIHTPKTLFIIVKSAQGQLLTAAKYTVTDVNKIIEAHIVDGQEGLMQMMPLSSSEDIVVTARISQTGRTAATTGDLTSKPISIHLPQDKSIPIVIDSVVN